VVKVAQAEDAQLRQLAEELLLEAEAKAQEAVKRLEAVQARIANEPPQQVQQTILQAQQAERQVVLDEAETRRLVDRQLQAAGGKQTQSN